MKIIINYFLIFPLTLFAAQLSVQEQYSEAINAYQNQDWTQLLIQSETILKEFPLTPFAEEAEFYLGVSYFHLADYEMANRYLSHYLKKHTAPKYFEKAIEYKFEIAEQFKNGAKKHLMGWEKLPKWVPAGEAALQIYEEVITALPHHDVAAKALFSKAKLLFNDEDYKATIDAYQTLIRRFPKHPLSPDSYVGIGGVYLTQARLEFPDPDFMELAEINLRKFRQDFPSDERVQINEQMLMEMREIYATNLYETGKFFERTKKPKASMIYYSKVLAKYPGTLTAARAEKRLGALKAKEKKS